MRNRSRSHAARRAMAVLERGMAETVIGGAPVAVLEHVIGFVDFLELVFAILVAGIAVGMPLHRELAIGGFQFAVIRRA